MLLVVVGVVVVGIAAGFALASLKARRIGRGLAAAGYLREEPAAAVFRRRIAVCAAVALAGIVLIVAGSVWTPG